MRKNLLKKHNLAKKVKENHYHVTKTSLAVFLDMNAFLPKNHFIDNSLFTYFYGYTKTRWPGGPPGPSLVHKLIGEKP